MSVQIADCTIRDGGYLLNKNSNPEFVKGIINGLVAAGINFIETGFLQNTVNNETIVYHNSEDVIKYLAKDCGKSNYLGFCDNSRYSIENLDEYTGRSFKWLRISFAKHEIDSALKFCKEAMNKGYFLQCNPMDTISYTDGERAALIDKVNRIRPQCFSIVDTFGAMDMSDLVHVFKQVDSLLDKDIKIGLHSHDNLGLSCALAERMIELSQQYDRDVIVDGSLYGMGRGAGNAKTELLADYINKHCGGVYDIHKILETIDKYITPIIPSIHWGYDIPMYICGTKHSHVDNAYHLDNNYHCTANEMYDVIESLTPQQRTRYGKGYSKSDFSVLDKAYEDYSINKSK
jgi:4-hydroxy 2-oxovalerate aldolase